LFSATVKTTGRDENGLTENNKILIFIEFPTMVNRLLVSFTGVTMLLNRVLARVDFVIHYISGYLLSYFVGDHKPQCHTRPKKASNSREAYSPSVVVTGSSEGPQASLIRVNTITY
jgi:hypothetical protein